MAPSTNSETWNSNGQFISETQVIAYGQKVTSSLWMSAYGSWHAGNLCLTVRLCCIRNIDIHCLKNTVFLDFWGASGYTCKSSCLQTACAIYRIASTNAFENHWAFLRLARCTWALHPFLATLTGLELGGTALPHPASFTYVFQATAGASWNLGSQWYRHVWESDGLDSTMSLGLTEVSSYLSAFFITAAAHYRITIKSKIITMCVVNKNMLS